MLDNKSVLVTGGTGSFGQKFIDMVFERYSPSRVIVYSRDEFKQDMLKNEFQKKLKKDQFSKIRFFIGDVRDRDRLYRAFNE